MRETRAQSLGREDLLEKGRATHSSILARPPKMGSKKYPVLGTLNTLSLIFTIVKQYLYYNKVAITSVFSVRKLKHKAVVTFTKSLRYTMMVKPYGVQMKHYFWVSL